MTVENHNDTPKSDGHIWTVESPNRVNWYYEAHSLDAALRAAAEMRTDFPGDEFVIFRDGEYDARATGMAVDGMVL